MSDIKPIESIIKQARSRLILGATAAEHTGDLVAKIDWQNRRAFLDNLLKEFRELKSGPVPGKSVFISYSLNSGRVYFDVLSEKLRSAGFEVVTGFQKAPGDRGGVLSRILGQLRRSTVYLGLLTKEMRVKGPRRTEQWSPSVWTMEEKGMALALGKPFVLLVQDGIHTDYWLKTAPDKVHLTFNEETFGIRAKEVVEVITERHEELVLEFLGHPDLPLSRHAVSETRDQDD
jgi:hypothetical protein